MSTCTLPGLSPEGSANIAHLLQQRLNADTDLHLTLTHVHWNLVGPNFIGVHEMLDTQVDAVRGYADEVAERIAALATLRTAHRTRSSPSAPGRTRIRIRSGRRLGRSELSDGRA